MLMRTRNKRFFSSINAALVATVIGVVAVMLYSAYVALPFVQGPIITINEPVQTEAGTTLLSGTASRVSKLAINELEVPITDTGVFSVERAFPPGYTVVVIHASDRFGRDREHTLTFVTQSHASKKESDNEESSENQLEEGSDGIEI